MKYRCHTSTHSGDIGFAKIQYFNNDNWWSYPTCLNTRNWNFRINLLFLWMSDSRQKLNLPHPFRKYCWFSLRIYRNDRPSSVDLFFLWLFIQLQKTNFMHQLILKILDFQESCNLIGQDHLGQHIKIKNFGRHGICDVKSRITIKFLSCDLY